MHELKQISFDYTYVLIKKINNNQRNTRCIQIALLTIIYTTAPELKKKALAHNIK